MLLLRVVEINPVVVCSLILDSPVLGSLLIAALGMGQMVTIVQSLGIVNKQLLKGKTLGTFSRYSYGSEQVQYVENHMKSSEIIGKFTNHVTSFIHFHSVPVKQLQRGDSF